MSIVYGTISKTNITGSMGWTFINGIPIMGPSGVVGTAPVFVSAAVANATPTKVVLTYDQDLDTGSVPATTDFTVTDHTVSGVAISGATVELTLSVQIYPFDVIYVTYTKGANPIKGDVGGLEADNLVSTLVTNNVTDWEPYFDSIKTGFAFYSDGTIVGSQLTDQSVNARHATIGDNIVTDAGAELGSSLVVWNSGTSSNSTEQAHSGTHSFKYVKTGASTVAGARFQYFRTKPGETVNWSFWIYPTVYSGGVIRLQVLKGDGTVGWQNLSATPTLNTWNQYSGSFDDAVGGGIGEIRFYIQTGDLTCYLDDMSITITGSTNIGVTMANDAVLKAIDTNNLFYTAGGIPRTIRNDIGDPTIWNTKLFCGGTNKWIFTTDELNVTDRYAVDSQFTDHDWIFDSCEVVKTVGSGKTYATIQLAIDSFTTGSFTNRCRIEVYDSISISTYAEYTKTVFTTYKDLFAIDKPFCYLDGIGTITVEGRLPEDATDDEMSHAALFDMFGSGGARNITFSKTNGRYVVHSDTSSNENSEFAFYKCRFYNNGMDEVVSYRNANALPLPALDQGGRDAWGCGSYVGTIKKFSECEFYAIYPYRNHNNINNTSNVFFFDCVLQAMPIYHPVANPDGDVLYSIYLDGGDGSTKSICYLEGCTINSTQFISDGWTLNEI